MEVLLNKLFDKHSEGYGVYDRENLIKDICKELQNLQLQQIGVIKSVCDCKPTEYYIDEIRYFKCRFCGKVMK
jgi:hypothetical protein